jgi:hypothetical protein
VHGRYARATLENRRAGIAAVRLLAHAMHHLGMVEGACRVRPLRADQWQALATLRPDTHAIADAAGLTLPR